MSEQTIGYELDKALWRTCKICSKTVKELAKTYGGNGKYFSYVFKKHLEIDHSIDFKEYFVNVCGIESRICPCGVCKQEVDIHRYGSKILWDKYSCGRNAGVIEWSQKAKETRKGAGNPQFGKKPWNQGLTKDNHPSILSNSIKNSNRVITEEHRSKMSEAAKRRKIQGHTGCHHSEETKEFLRQNTLRLIKEGVFKQNKSEPFLIMRAILNELALRFEEERILAFWSVDFYLNDYNLYIEVDGDYFHSNPKKYPNGPKTKTQWRNFHNDTRKNTYFKNHGIRYLRFWEDDLMNRPEQIKDQLLCKLKELSESKV